MDTVSNGGLLQPFGPVGVARPFRQHQEGNLVPGQTNAIVNRHTRESHIQRSFRTHCGTERQLGGAAAAGPARSSRRKSTLLAVPSLLDEKEFLQQMRAGPLDRRFPLFVGLRCMLFHIPGTIIGQALSRRSDLDEISPLRGSLLHDIPHLLRSFTLFCQCSFQRQVEVIPDY